MTPPLRAFILPTVLFALLILTAVGAGAWTAAHQSVMSARQAEGALRARTAAASAAARTLAAWDAPRFDALGAGGSWQGIAGGTGIAVALDVRRPGGDYYLLLATASDSIAPAQRTVAAFARLEPMVPEPRSALRLSADPGPALKERVSGMDQVPAGWACPTGGVSVTSVMIHYQDSANNRPALSPAWTWSRLARWAGRVAPGGDSLGLRHVAGDLVLDGGRHLGFFLVEGDLRVQGGALVVGTVIAGGDIVFEGSGGAILGGAVAHGFRADPATPLEAVRVGYSSCAVAMAGRSRAPALPVPWGWTADWYR